MQEHVTSAAPSRKMKKEKEGKKEKKEKKGRKNKRRIRANTLGRVKYIKGAKRRDAMNNGKKVTPILPIK